MTQKKYRKLYIIFDIFFAIVYLVNARDIQKTHTFLSRTFYHASKLYPLCRYHIIPSLLYHVYILLLYLIPTAISTYKHVVTLCRIWWHIIMLWFSHTSSIHLHLWVHIRNKLTDAGFFTPLMIMMHISELRNNDVWRWASHIHRGISLSIFWKKKSTTTNNNKHQTANDPQSNSFTGATLLRRTSCSICVNFWKRAWR